MKKNLFFIAMCSSFALYIQAVPVYIYNATAENVTVKGPFESDLSKDESDAIFPDDIEPGKVLVKTIADNNKKFKLIYLGNSTGTIRQHLGQFPLKGAAVFVIDWDRPQISGMS